MQIIIKILLDEHITQTLVVNYNSTKVLNYLQTTNIIYVEQFSEIGNILDLEICYIHYL